MHALILAEIVRGMFLNSGSHLRLLSEMKVHALDMYEAKSLIRQAHFDKTGIVILRICREKAADLQRGFRVFG